jgi:mannan endo-1,6-alpha-mannosidase
LISTSNQFFPKSGNGQIMSEITCEATKNCDRNQKTFKAYYASWLGFMSLIVPKNVTDPSMAKFKTSAVAAGQQCSGGKDGKHCGIRWTMQAEWDQTTGLEQEMAVLGVLNAIMVPFKQQGPYNVDNGGESKSNPNAGVDEDPKTRTITSGDRAGAGILTAVFVGTWVAGLAWAIWG